MDFLAELENMASTAQVDATDTMEEAVSRWQKLFSYLPKEAEEKISLQRSSLTAMVPAELWNAVQEQQERLGHDRASYSHWLDLSRRPKLSASAEHSTRDMADREYLFELKGPINSATILQKIAGLPHPPKVFSGPSESCGGIAHFCRIDGTMKAKVRHWLEKEAPSFEPLFITLSYAAKNFDLLSKAPTLGLDCTMPQNRPHNVAEVSPRQDEYPVWYFFYGTLADPAKLRGLFSDFDEKSTIYDLRPASVTGGRLTTWNGKYKALIDDTCIYPAPPVEGHALLVQTRDHEDALRSYETQVYEVVRCTIHFKDASSKSVQGCTFRFRGDRC